MTYLEEKKNTLLQGNANYLNIITLSAHKNILQLIN